MHLSSPTIAAVGSGYQIAFKAAGTNNLWTAGVQGTRDLGYGVAAGTSPAITGR